MMVKPTLYAYSPLTSEALGTVEAEPDPENAGGWLWPAFATDRVPPKVKPQTAAVFADGAWSLVTDHRGETWYASDGGAVTVDQLGDPTAFDPPLSADAPEQPAPPNVPATVFDYQFAGQAYAEGIIDFESAKAWTGSGVVPKVLLDAIDAVVTDPERHGRVVLFLMGTKEFPRNHELTPILAATFGKDTPEKLDAFFVAAGKR